MRSVRQHWEKIVLAVSILAVCFWGYFLLSQSIDLHEEVAMGETLAKRAVGAELPAFQDGDFTADRYVDAPSLEWADPGLRGKATPARPRDMVWCIRGDCNHWLPTDVDLCAYCGTDQEEVFESEDDELAPLRRRLFVERAVRQAFGARLQRVTEMPDRPKEEWNMQFSVRGSDGRRRTRFKRVGDTLDIQGVEHKIVDLEHKVETRYNPRIGDEETVDVSEVELVDPDGKSIVLVRGEDAYVGPWRVRLLLTDPMDRRFQEQYTVTSNETLRFEDIDGTRRRFEVEVVDEETVHLRPEEDPERVIEIGPGRPPREERPIPDYRLDVPEGEMMFDRDR